VGRHKSVAYAGIDPRQIDARRNEQRIYGRDRNSESLDVVFGAIDDALGLDYDELFELLDEDEDDEYGSLFAKIGQGLGKGIMGIGKRVGKGTANLGAGLGKGMGKGLFKKQGGGGGGGLFKKKGGGFKPFSVFKKKEGGGGGGLFKKKDGGGGFKPFSVFKKKEGGGDGGISHIAPPPQVAQAAPVVYQAPLYSAPQPVAPTAPVLLPWMTGFPAPAPAVPATRREKRLMKKQLRQEHRGVGTAAKLEKESLRQQKKELKQTRFGLEAVPLFGEF